MRYLKGLSFLALTTAVVIGASGMAQADDKLVIGWSQRISGSDWWKTMVAGAEAKAAEPVPN